MNEPLGEREYREVDLTVPQAERIALVLQAAESYAHTSKLRHVLAREGVYSSSQAANARLLLGVVQAFGREVDPPGRDVLAAPQAVVERQRGDCLSLSGLLVAWLKAVGIRATLAAISRPCDEQDHVAVVAILDGKATWLDPASMLPAGSVTHGVECPLPEVATLM